MGKFIEKFLALLPFIILFIAVIGLVNFPSDSTNILFKVKNIIVDNIFLILLTIAVLLFAKAWRRR